ncbi:MAG: alpha-1,2-fucosyltransferase [bacterium]|nr:alpha-1,2-fucosyltransferase [bacterium]
MIIVRLKGGLGNQMFQYSLGRVLSLRYNTEFKLDTSFFDLNLKNVTKRGYDLDVFNIQAQIASKSDIPFVFRLYDNAMVVYLISIFRKIVKSRGQEKSFNFDSSIFNIGKDAYFEGYWQSPKYFEGFEDMIRKDFTLKNLPTQNIQELAKEISNTEALCIHVRRGDYVGNPNHEVVTKGYYNQCVGEISKTKNIGKIYVFSDDIDWCRNNLSFSFPTMFVENEYSGVKGEGHMFLMSLCKYFVIPNSTFSWWAAWLCVYKDKIVIAPKQWFPDESIDTSDLIPKEWLRI